MFQGTWLTYKLYDGTLPLQGVYIIESYGHVIRVGQTDNLERRRGEHVRNGTADGLLYPDPNFIVMPVPHSALLDGIETYLGRVLAVPADGEVPGSSRDCMQPSCGTSEQRFRSVDNLELAFKSRRTRRAALRRAQALFGRREFWAQRSSRVDPQNPMIRAGGSLQCRWR